MTARHEVNPAEQQRHPGGKDGLWRASCSCGYITGFDSKRGAETSARQHADQKNSGAMDYVIISSDLEDLVAHESPLLSLQDTVAFSSADWGAERDRAWIYGIVLGWDDDPNDADPGDPPELRVNAMDIVAKRCRWGPEQVARLRRLHEAFIALGGKPL